MAAMSIEWFEVEQASWEGLDLRFTHFHFSVSNTHPTRRGWLLGICSPEYENTCVPLGLYRTLDQAREAASLIGDTVFTTAVPEN